MCDLAALFLHLLTTVARLAGPGGARSVIAESVLVKHQLPILNRSRKHSPRLRPADRLIAGLCALFIRPGRLVRSAIVLKPSTLLRLHRALITRKYRLLFSAKATTKPGPKGPSQKVVAAGTTRMAATLYRQSASASPAGWVLVPFLRVLEHPYNPASGTERAGSRSA